MASATKFPFDPDCTLKRKTTLLYPLCCLYEYVYLFSVSIFIQVFLIDGVLYRRSPNGRHVCYTATQHANMREIGRFFISKLFIRSERVNCPSLKRQHRWISNRLHILKLCLLLWFEFFRTIALLLGALRDLIAGYSKLSSASVECRREIFGRTNFHLRVVSFGINVSSTFGRTAHGGGDGTGSPDRKDAPPFRLLDFSSSNSFVYTDVMNLGILC